MAPEPITAFATWTPERDVLLVRAVDVGHVMADVTGHRAVSVLTRSSPDDDETDEIVGLEIYAFSQFDDWDSIPETDRRWRLRDEVATLTLRDVARRVHSQRQASKKLTV